MERQSAEADAVGLPVAPSPATERKRQHHLMLRGDTSPAAIMLRLKSTTSTLQAKTLLRLAVQELLRQRGEARRKVVPVDC